MPILPDSTTRVNIEPPQVFDVLVKIDSNSHSLSRQILESDANVRFGLWIQPIVPPKCVHGCAKKTRPRMPSGRQSMERHESEVPRHVPPLTAAGLYNSSRRQMVDEALGPLRGGGQLVEQLLAGHAERDVVGDGGAEAPRGLRVEPHLVEHQQARAEFEAFLFEV
jgi:hypothetical protein